MASAKLTRTFTAGNRRTYTISLWLKRAGLGSSPNYQAVFIASGGDDGIFFKNDNTLDCFFHSIEKRTTRVFRDTNAWYHIVVAVDTTQSSASDRLKIYVNGEQETNFAYSSGDPALNNEHLFNNSGGTNVIGNHSSSSYNFDGQMAHVHFIDGTAYTPSAFGQTDATTGIWKPKTAPSVTYGTNGFFLKFDNSANMGLDSAGSNNLTTTGTIIQNKDTPSNVFATLNLLHFGFGGISNTTLTNTNTTFTSTQGGSPYPYYFSTLGATKGKYYAEFKHSAGVNGDAASAGIGHIPDQYSGNNSLSWSYYANGNVYNGGSSASYGNAWNVGDILGIAMDLDNSKVYFSMNGVWQNSGVPTSGSTGTGARSITANTLYQFEVGDAGGNQPTIQCNFGNGYFGTTAVSSAQSPDDGKGIFEYDVPAGYRALCTESINAQEYS